MEGDSVAETLESSNQALLKSLSMEAIEVVRAELLISLLALQQMVDDREYGVGYCDERALSAHPRREAAKLPSHETPRRLTFSALPSILNC